METFVTKKVSLVLCPMEMKERIQLKADELFHQYGIKSVTMDELASQMGISKKTIYQFFGDKDELVNAVIIEKMKQSKEECIEYENHSENAIHEIFLALNMMEEMLTTMNPSLLNDLEKYHPKAYREYYDFKNEFLYAKLKVNIERGIAEGLYREDVNVEIIARYRVATLMMSMANGVFPKNKFSLLEIESQLLVHFLYGMCTIKGYKLIEKYKIDKPNLG